MKPFEIRAKLKDMGFKEDRYGNMLTPNGFYRVHFNSVSLRIERRVQIRSSRLDSAQNIVDSVKTHWQNLRTVYYTNIVTQDGVLRVGTLELTDYAAPAVAA